MNIYEYSENHFIPLRAINKHSSSQQNIHMHISVFRLEYLFVCCCRSMLMYCTCVLYTVIEHIHIAMAMALFSDQLNIQMIYQLWIFHSLRSDEYIQQHWWLLYNNIDTKKQTATAWRIPIKTAPCIVRSCFRIGQWQHICNMIAIKIVLMFNFN